jgi:hypothetical protein
MLATTRPLAVQLAFLLADLPVEFLGRLRWDRVLRLPARARLTGTIGRPCATPPTLRRIPSQGCTSATDPLAEIRAGARLQNPYRAYERSIRILKPILVVARLKTWYRLR